MPAPGAGPRPGPGPGVLLLARPPLKPAARTRSWLQEREKEGPVMVFSVGLSTTAVGCSGYFHTVWAGHPAGSGTDSIIIIIMYAFFFVFLGIGIITYAQPSLRSGRSGAFHSARWIWGGPLKLESVSTFYADPGPATSPLSGSSWITLGMSSVLVWWREGRGIGVED